MEFVVFIITQLNLTPIIGLDQEQVTLGVSFWVSVDHEVDASESKLVCAVGQLNGTVSFVVLNWHHIAWSQVLLHLQLRCKSNIFTHNVGDVNDSEVIHIDPFSFREESLIGSILCEWLQDWRNLDGLANKEG